MLKPAEQASPPDEERGVGEIVSQLVDDGKAYARAEFDLARAIAAAKANAVKLPAMLFAAAFLFVQAAVTVLAVATFGALLRSMGPVAAGLIAFLLFAAIAGGLGWLAVKKLREGL